MVTIRKSTPTISPTTREQIEKTSIKKITNKKRIKTTSTKKEKKRPHRSE